MTVGPAGETATPVSALTLNEAGLARIQAGGHTAALALRELCDWSSAESRGARDEFARRGIEVVAETDAGFGPARQQADVETIMAFNLSILNLLPGDPTQGASTHAAARDGGARTVFIDDTAASLVQGVDHVTTVSSDLVASGGQTSRAMNDALGGAGQVGHILHDADFPVTNQRDQASSSVAMT